MYPGVPQVAKFILGAFIKVAKLNPVTLTVLLSSSNIFEGLIFLWIIPFEAIYERAFRMEKIIVFAAPAEGLE